MSKLVKINSKMNFDTEELDDFLDAMSDLHPEAAGGLLYSSDPTILPYDHTDTERFTGSSGGLSLDEEKSIFSSNNPHKRLISYTELLEETEDIDSVVDLGPTFSEQASAVMPLASCAYNHPVPCPSNSVPYPSFIPTSSSSIFSASSSLQINNHVPFKKNTLVRSNKQMLNFIFPADVQNMMLDLEIAVTTLFKYAPEDMTGIQNLTTRAQQKLNPLEENDESAIFEPLNRLEQVIAPLRASQSSATLFHTNLRAAAITKAPHSARKMGRR